MSANTQPNHWQDFWETLKERFFRPGKHPTFVMYFIGIIIFVGGLGLLEPVISTLFLGESWKTESIRLISACYTYFLAIAATAAVDVILSVRHQKYFLMLFLCSCFIVLSCAFLAVITKAASPAIFGYVLALLLWWIGNADNTNLLDTPVKHDAPIGGDAEAKLVGNMNGIKH